MTEAERAAIRREALEEAAKIIEGASYPGGGRYRVWSAIPFPPKGDDGKIVRFADKAANAIRARAAREPAVVDDDEPVDTGEWIPATVRITGISKSHLIDPDDDPEPPKPIADHVRSLLAEAGVTVDDDTVERIAFAATWGAVQAIKKADKLAEWLQKNEAAAPEPPASGWRPMETAPEDGTRVLLYAKKYGPTTGHFAEGRWFAHSCLDRHATLIAWMPLPEPPADPGTRAGDAAGEK